MKNENKSEFINMHTDLAVENREQFKGQNVEISGVELSEYDDIRTGIRITKVAIVSKEGEKAMGKPRGNYITLDITNVGEERIEVISETIASQLKVMMPEEKKPEEMSVMVVGLGNRDVTPDALGPQVVSGLRVNRHMSVFTDKKEAEGISAVIPGVMAQTGMESAEMVSAIAGKIKPDVIIAIDALASRSIKRLGNTVQIADTGINPGSGVGNHRMGLTKELLNIPVIAIGIPTVIDAATIVYDTMERTGLINDYTDEERYRLIREILQPKMGNLFVTPKDIDQDIQDMAEYVSEGINKAFNMQ